MPPRLKKTSDRKSQPSPTPPRNTKRSAARAIAESSQAHLAVSRGLPLAGEEQRDVLSAAEIAAIYLDRELRLQRYSAQAQILFGLADKDRGQPAGRLGARIGDDQLGKEADQVLRGGTPGEREYRHDDGRWYLMRLHPRRGTQDQIDGVVLTFVDITRLKESEQELVRAKEALEERMDERTRELDRANQKLRRARDLFHALFNANPVPTALISLEDHTFTDVNSEFLSYFGISREDLSGYSLEGFAARRRLDLQAQELDEVIAEIKEHGKPRNYEAEFTHPSGERRSILASLQHLQLEGIEALIATFIDITARVRAEQEIRNLASELTATEQAERHRLSQILHDDLQQRIFAIQMQLSFLRDAYEKNDLKAFSVDFPQLEEWLAEAIKVTRHLSVDLSPPILHGEGLVEAVIWLAAQMEEQYGLKTTIESSGTPAALEDKVRVLIFYAIRELLFNIVKHAKASEAAVRFEHEAERMLVIVQDRGAGFNSTEVMTNPNTAHGLLIVRHRLNLLDCSMDIRSRRGSGTTVTIEVPHTKAGASA